mmetsp:Transcript_3230/g.8973  ORF Transcript_3230/g.8973 Transcript_3230/m.8973 type:complete len:303 (+) Transcript_3230:2380-3288(+)
MSSKHGKLRCACKAPLGLQKKLMCDHDYAFKERLAETEDELLSSYTLQGRQSSNAKPVDGVDGSDNEDLDVFQQVPASVSSMRINPSQPTPAMQQRQRHELLGMKPHCSECLGHGRVFEACTHCMEELPACCSSSCGGEWRGRMHTASLSSMGHTATVTVVNWECDRCGETREYDGNADGIYNHDGSFLFLHEFLFDYWDSVRAAGTTFSAHWASMSEAHAKSSPASACFRPPPMRKIMVAALWGFMRLLDVNWSAFGCPCCNTLPPEHLVLIMDATTIGHRSDLVTARRRKAIGDAVPELA